MGELKDAVRTERCEFCPQGLPTITVKLLKPGAAECAPSSCLVVMTSAGLFVGYGQIKVNQVRRNTLNMQYNLCVGAMMANGRNTTPVDVAEAIEKFFSQQGFECRIAGQRRACAIDPTVSPISAEPRRSEPRRAGSDQVRFDASTSTGVLRLVGDRRGSLHGQRDGRNKANATRTSRKAA
jgi:hypothetical protein